MKNKREYIIIILFIIIVIICFFYIFKFKNSHVDSRLYNKKWYNYNALTGTYNVFSINNNDIDYIRLDDNINYDNCSKYTYNKRKNIFNFDCGKDIQISKVEKNKMIMIIEDKKYVYYDNINDTLNYEFELYYGKSMSEYKKDMSRVLNFIKIDDSTIKDLMLDDEYSKFIFIGNKCSSYECIASLSTLEKWISKTKNIYYINIEDINQKYLDEINKIDNRFDNNIENYNKVYPLIILTKNGKVIDKYDFKCNGFDCSMFDDNEF